jgi:hypothetical protein
MRSIEFTLVSKKFKLESDGNVRRVIDRNNVEWSDVQLIELGGEIEATTALAYAQRDLERFTQYGVSDER